MITVAPADPGSPDARLLLGELDAALAAITGDSGAASFAPGDVRGPRAVFMLAHGKYVGSASSTCLGRALV